MKARRDSRNSAIRVVNLEAGRPTVHEALSRLDRELVATRREGCSVVKLIHGYGSTGAGGDIRIAVQARLAEMVRRDQIRACIFGEDWTKADERAWKLLQARPELKQDHDLGRRNAGITIVVL
jgi:hypothetical protein